MSKAKLSGALTNWDSFKAAKMHKQQVIAKQKKSFFEEEIVENRKRPKEMWKFFTWSKFEQSK